MPTNSHRLLHSIFHPHIFVPAHHSTHSSYTNLHHNLLGRSQLLAEHQFHLLHSNFPHPSIIHSIQSRVS
ncbi:hypothetical protein K438DRAFT_1855632 [Mycena galopus ATCC 62051]|nr:hypothetical protein K438DRAFT_1855632 [Mycena galopus ATCC 62051]